MGASDRDYLRDRGDPGDAWRGGAAPGDDDAGSSTPLWAKLVLALLALSFLATAVVSGF